MSLQPSNNIQLLSLHPAQENVYFDQMRNPLSAMYNIAGYQEIKKNYNPKILLQTWQLLHQHIDAFRLKITHNENDGPCQYIEQYSNNNSKIIYIDFSKENLPNEHAYHWMQHQVNTPMAFSEGETFQLGLIQLADNHHFLFIRSHHLVNDGMGMYRLFEYLHKVYNCLHHKKSTDWLTTLPQYREIILNSQRYLASKRYEKDKNYWQDFFAHHENTRLTPYYQQNNNHIKSNELTIRLTETLSENIHRFCQINMVSPLVILSNVASIYFSNITQQSKYQIGIAFHGRHGRSAMGVIGMHSSVIGIACTIQPEITFTTLSKDMKMTIQQGLRHARFPTSHISRFSCNVNNPLFDVIINYEYFQNITNEDTHNTSQIIDTHHLNNCDDVQPLQIRILDYGWNNSMSLKITYSCRYFTQKEISLLSDRIIMLIQHGINSPDMPLKNFPFLPEAEYATVCHKWNRTDAPYLNQITVANIFEAQVSKTPDQLALVFESERLTYQALNTRVNQLAHTIRTRYQQHQGHSFKADTLIALYLERSVEMVVSMLAVQKAGGAYVPISTSYPKERIQFILSDTQTPIIITQECHLDHLKHTLSEQLASTHLLVIDTPNILLDAPVTNPENINVPSDLAYVIYTSGTTGNPKGVMLTHQNLLHLVTDQATLFDINELQSSLLFAAYVFDASVSELFTFILNGIAIFLCTEAERTSPDLLAELIHREQIECATLPPAILTLMDSHALKPLKCLITAGEAPSLEILQRFSEQNCRVLNAYGPTEATVCVSAHQFATDSIAHNIGKAMNNTRLYVLNQDLQPVPIGVSGELYIGGAGLARGYLNRPDLTNQAFIPHPLATANDLAKGYTRLYKTGDLVRWLDNGDLEYLGRNDFQVKIRGFRIELGEIEAVLSGFLEIKQSVVIDRDNEGHKYLAAYVIPHANKTLDLNQLREKLTDILPDYMVPSAFVQLEHIPLTINGKTDRRALPEPDLSNQVAYVAPRNILEIKICTLWQHILGLKQVSIYDNFFRVGGDSIIAIQLVSQLRREGYSLQVKDVFDAPTIAQLARQLETTHVRQVIPYEQGILVGDFKLLPIQQWFVKRTWHNPNYWNQSFLMKITGDISIVQIQQAIDQINQKHDMLRCRLVMTPDGYQQRYHATNEHTMMPLIDLDCSPFTDESLQLKLSELQSHFNLTEGPLWRIVHLTGYADGSARLFFSFHHFIIDTVSWRILTEDMNLLLHNKPLSPKTSSYRQWVNFVHAYPNTHQHEQYYWRNVFDGYQTPPTLQAQTQRLHIILDAAQTDTLLHRANLGYNTEINSLLLAALSLALKETLGHKAHPILFEGHGREVLDHSLDLSNTVGWFTAAYPLKLTSCGDAARTIIRTREMLSAIPNKGLGFGALKQAGLLNDLQMPAISFNYLGQLNTQNEGMWEITNEPSGTWIDEQNSDGMHLAINAAVLQDKLTVCVDSRLHDDLTHCFIAAFETALINVTEVAAHAAINGAQIEAIYPATSLQQGFIYHFLNDPSHDAYRVQVLFDYPHELNIFAYQKAWAFASERHPALRTFFEWEEDILQITTTQRSITQDNFVLHDLSHLSDTQRATEIHLIQQQDQARPFDLSKPGLLRFHIIKQADSLYTVLKTEHHSISDGWSGPVLLNTVHSYYDSLNTGNIPIIQRENAYLQAQAYHMQHRARTEAFWALKKAQFSHCNDINTLLSRPIDPHSPLTIPEIKNQKLSIEAIDYQHIKAMCKQQGVTINAVIQFVWHKLLQSYTQDEQTIVGTIISGRGIPIPDIEASVGLFINTLPLAINWQAGQSCLDILQHIQSSIAALDAYSGINLSSLQLKGARLFDTLLVFENYPASEDATGIAEGLILRDVVEQTDYPLTITAFEQPDALSIHLKFDARWTTEAQARQLLSQMTCLLQCLVKSPECPHEALHLFTRQEYQTIVYDWNRTDQPYQDTQTFHTAFATQVARTPDHIALVFDNVTLTYNELNTRANQLAHLIQAKYQDIQNKAITPDTLIALYFDRSLEMVISILAVLKAGAAYVPISPESPLERTQFILEDTRTAILLTQSHYLAELTLCAHSVNPLLEPIIVAPKTASTFPNTNPKYNNQADDLAYVIYTSGTTGKPKGVMISHKNIMHITAVQQQGFALRENQTMLMFSAYVFDASVFDLFVSLITGMKIILCSEIERKDPQLLSALINKESIDLALLPPAIMALLDPTALTGLKKIATGGEAPSAKLLQDFSRSNQIFNLYGPTEATIYVTSHQYQVGDHANNIGKAIANTRLYVLDTALNPLPVGVAGELYIGGAGIARGYLNQPILTAELFITNPFATEIDKEKGYTRLYKTGDKVRWLSNGELEYLGRNDFQVKIHGYRIELGEIEAILNTLPIIKQAVVIEYKKSNLHFLAAYLVPLTSAPIDMDLIREKLSKILPEYMIPRAFNQLTHIPLTINGKIDYQKLPEPDLSDQTKHVEPRNELESELALIWQAVLGLSLVSIHDNFFRVGGDSIIAIQLVSRLRQQNYSIQVKDIFDAPTIAKLAERLDKPVSDHLLEAEQGILTGDFSLLPIQKWFFEQSWQKPSHWNQSFIIKIPNTISTSSIAEALQTLSQQHDMLRCRFIPTDAGYVQRYHDNADTIMAPLLCINTAQLSAEELQTQLTTLQSQFDLTHGFIWQVAHLTGYSDGNARLFLAFHHLIIDVVSWRIIVEDLRILLHSKKLLPKTNSYRQWVDFIASYPTTHAYEVFHWRNVLSVHKPLPDLQNAFIVQLELDNDYTHLLRHRANSGYHTEINSLLLTALSIALTATFEQRIHTILLEGHGREAFNNNYDLSNTVGWFTNVYPIKLTTCDQIAKTIIRTQTMLNAIPNKGLGFGVLKQAGYLDECQSPTISFNYLGQLNSASTTQNEDLWQITDELAGTWVDTENTQALHLNINGAILGETLGFRIESQLTQEMTQTFTTTFKQALQNVIDEAVRATDTGIKIEAIYPATSLQQGFIYHFLRHSEDDAYRIQVLVDYPHALNLTAYQKAWTLASACYPVLRTFFEWQDDLLQITQTEPSITASNFKFHDISQLPNEARIQAITTIQQQDRLQPFNLGTAGLIRFNIIKQADSLYTVLKTEHHSISDGWSGPVLLNTVHNYYDCLNAGNIPIIHRENTYLQAQAYHLQNSARTEAFWALKKTQFQDGNDINMLLSRPIDPYPSEIIPKPGDTQLMIEGETYSQLKIMCRNQGITLNTTLQFAWHKLLQCYTQDAQTIVGTVISGRGLPVSNIEASVGLFINTLPLSVDWDTQVSCGNLLQKIQKDIAELDSYSGISLASLQTNGSALFDSLFVFENYPALTSSESGIAQGLAIRDVIEKSDYPLSLLAFEQAQSLSIHLKFDQRWVTPRHADQLLSQMKQVLDHLIHSPNSSPATINFLNPQEYQTILYDWNATNAKYAHEQTICQLFEAQAARTPTHTALIFEEQSLSYTVLNQRVNQLAHLIRTRYVEHQQREITPDTLIALYFDRSVEMIISMLAVQKAGGAYVPIAPSYPQERVQYILADTATDLLLTQTHYLAKLQRNYPHLDLISVDNPEYLASYPDTNPERINVANDLAYVIYTSGTTGKPKGTLLSHRNLTHLIAAEAALFDLRHHQRTLLFSAYVFDASVFELFAFLLNGATLVLCTENERTNPTLLAALIHRHKIEFATLPPAILNLMDAQALQPLKSLVTAGEAPSLEILQRFSQQGCRVYNAYGPTETSVCATIHKYDQCGSPSNIGKALNNVHLYVLNQLLKPVPIGVPGELYIGGAGLARGYLNRPDLTTAAFIDNPFADTEDKIKGYTRLYKTGDTVRWLENGDLEYLGRNDSQVKIRGYRVELGEIEAALTAQSVIQQAVVIHHKENGNGYLAAYLLAATHETLDIALLKATLALTLPDYMLPAVLIQVATIPLTINGKIDRNKLPKPQFITQTDYIAPENPLEITLSAIWQDVLSLELISTQENFFNIGGNSISAIRVITEINHRLDTTISLASLFIHNTIATLANYLTNTALSQNILKPLTPYITTKQPIFMIHPAVAGCEVYHSLAQLLTPHFNCFGIDNYNLISENKTDSLSALAELYLDIIQQECDLSQPIRLLGWSLGGYISMEIAYHLEQKGATNIHLYLLDTVVHPHLVDTQSADLNHTPDPEAANKTIHALKTQMLEENYDEAYIDKILSVYHLERRIGTSPLSGILHHTTITLFKAGLQDPRFSQDEKMKIANQEIHDLVDNNISHFVTNNINILHINNRHHHDIIKENIIIAETVLNDLEQAESQ